MAGANNDYPLMDGFAPSWADISASIYGEDLDILVKHLKSVSGGSTLEPGTQLLGGRPYATSVGSSSHEGKLSLYAIGAQIFMRGLKNAAVAKGFVRDGGIVQVGLVHFDLDYRFTPPGTSSIFERSLRGCRLVGISEAPAEGSDPLVIEYTLSVTDRTEMVDGVQVALI